MANESDGLIGKDISSAYRIIRKVGDGAASTVYEVQNRRGHQLALKVYNHEAAKYASLDANVLHKLSHPNIVKLYDFDGDGFEKRPWMLLEWAPINLEERLIEEGRVSSINGLKKDGMAFLDALKYIHESGILHKDLKAKNILFDPQNVLKITDFNVAQEEVNGKKKGKTGIQMSSLPTSLGGKTTLQGGTDGWAAPEQILKGKIDYTTDVFGAGAVLYSMVTGSRTPALSRELPSKYGAQKWINKLIERAMATNQEERFQSVADMKLFFEKGLEGKLGSENSFGKKLKSLGHLLKEEVLPWVLTLGIILGPPAFFITKDIIKDNRLEKELKEERGTIAYAYWAGKELGNDGKVYIVNARNILDKDRDEKTISFPNGGFVKNLLWSNDSKQLFILRKDENEVKDKQIDYFDRLYAVNIESNELKLLHDFQKNKLEDVDWVYEMKGSKDGKIFVQGKSKNWYCFDFNEKKFTELPLSRWIESESRLSNDIVEFVDQLNCHDGKHYIDEADNYDLDFAEICNENGGDIRLPRFNCVRAAWSPVK